jgi:hypothetical protein
VGLSLRDRFFTPKVARAMTSPSGILAAGGGAALGLAAGFPAIVAVVVGVGAWALRVGAAMGSGRPKGDRIDPFTLQEPWRRAMQDAIGARARFREAVGRTRSGPLQDTLRDIAGQMDTLVNESWLIANRGESLVQTRRRIDTRDIANDLSEATQALGTSPGDESLKRTIESLEAQQATAERMDKVIEQARSQLRLLDARMGEAVVRALELSAQASADASVSTLSTDVDTMVSDMEALRQAMEETHGALPAAGGSGSGSSGALGLDGDDTTGGMRQGPAT